MALTVGTLVAYLDLDKSAFSRKLDDTEDDAKRSGGKSGKGFGDEFGRESDKSLRDKLAGSAGGIMQAFGGFMTAAAKPTAVSVATGFSAQLVASVAAGLASGAAKLAHGLGAGLALLPAAGVAAGLVLGTVKLALLGVGDALEAGLAGDAEKFNEALKDMAPAAQSVLREVAGLKGEFDELKSTVQENFFAPLVGQARPLADLYLPAIRAAMAGIAAQFGATARQSVEFLKLPATADSLRGALAQAGMAGENVVGVVGNLVQAFVPLVTVGASFLPGLTNGFAGASARFAEFMAQAEQSGRLREFIQGGIDSVRELVETGRQVGRILGNIADIGKIAFEGMGLASGGLLDTIERLTERAREFFETSAGGEALSGAMEAAGALASAFLGTLQKIGTMIAPFIPQIVRFATSFANLKTAILDALGPAVEFIGGVVLPALSSLMEWLASNQPVLQGILISLFTIWAIHAGIAAAATIAATWPLILFGVAVAALAALVIIHFDTIKNVVMGVYNWIKDNWQLLLIILTGPIGAAVALIVAHWDTIWNAGKAVYQWIVDNWHLLLGILTNPIGAAVGFIVDNFNGVVSFIAGLPARIGAAASGMWNGITDAFKSAINTIIRWWNNLSFPRFDIPSIDPLGSFGPSIGGGHIGGWQLPNIGELHTGGQVNAGGPGREALRILEHGEEVLARTSPRHRDNLGSTPQAGGALAGRITIDVTGTDREMVEMVRKRIDADFGGDVQVALGQS